MSREDDIKELIEEHYSRLQKRKVQEAKYGLDAPPHVLRDIEDAEKKIEDLQAELKETTESSVSSGKEISDQEVVKISAGFHFSIDDNQLKSSFYSEGLSSEQQAVLYELLTISARWAILTSQNKIIKQEHYQFLDEQLLSIVNRYNYINPIPPRYAG